MLAIYSKFFSIKPDKILNINLAISLKGLIIFLNAHNLVYLSFLNFTAKVRYN